MNKIDNLTSNSILGVLGQEFDLVLFEEKVAMGLKFTFKQESFSLEVGGPSYGQNKNIGSGKILIESPHKTLLTFFTQIIPH